MFAWKRAGGQRNAAAGNSYPRAKTHGRRAQRATAATGGTRMFKRPVSWLTVICLVLIVAMASSTLTLLLAGAAPADTADGDDPLARAREILEIVERDYYTEVDEEQLATGAIRGMLATLEDPYTFYYTTEEYQAMNEETTGQYSGVGMLVGLDGKGNLMVMRVFRNSPAMNAGVQAGDLLVAVDGAPVAGETSQDLNAAVALLKGDDQTPVDATFERDGERLTFTLTRGAVNINYVEYSVLEGVTEALSAFREAGVRALVVDVRSNPGGLLDDVVQICDLLVPEGLIVYTEDRQGRRQEYYADADYWDVPMAVLVNGMSASASEIFAAAVQESGRGVIVGETTYGKGIVQTLFSFSEGDGVQLTTSAYYTASGASIHGQGVTPDIEVSLTDDDPIVYYAPDPEGDEQLRAALEALNAA